MTKFMEVRENTNGIDYFSGDVHGCITKLEAAMRAVRFDKSKDRLFLVGDLVDRGPESHRVIELFNQKHIYALQGNHDCVTSYAAKKQLIHDRTLDKNTRISLNHGGEWVEHQKRRVLEEFIEGVAYLPIAIEYQDQQGRPLLGLIHGEVPMTSSWTALAEHPQKLPWDYVPSLLNLNAELLHQAQWGRTKITAANLEQDYASDKYRTEGIPYLACGHSIVPQQEGGPFRVANNRYIDHGLYCNHDQAILYTLEQLIGPREKHHK
ncbi:MAG: metallophosphoesterase [Hafnia sp.]